MEVSIAVIWGIVSGLVGAGIAWGALLMRSKQNTARIEAVKSELESDVAELRTVMTTLADTQLAHRVETTDRLARIESKLDAALER